MKYGEIRRAEDLDGQLIVDSQDIAATLDSLEYRMPDCTGIIVQSDGAVWATESSRPYLCATRYEYIGSLEL